MRKYKEWIDVLKNLNIFIFISMNRFNLIYLRNQKTIHQKLSILKKRLASTNRVRKLEMIRKYKDLQRALKHQQMNQWLLNWKKIYAKTKRLNLSDVQNDRCAYDFLNSLRTMNLSFVFDKKTILNHEMNQSKSSTSIRNLLEEFRNHLRIARALITKKTTHEIFATLQEKSSNDETTDQKKSEKFSNRKNENRSCLCDRKHSFSECYYLIEKLRSTVWKSNEEMKKIEKILETNSRIRSAVKWVRKNVKRRLKKVIEKENDLNDESSRKKSFFDDEHLQIRFLTIDDDRHVRCFSSYSLHFRRYRSSSQRMKFDRCFLANKQRSFFIVKHDYILQFEIIVWFDILFSFRFDRLLENIVRIVSFDSFALSFHLKILYIRFTFVLFASFI
jgi:hypothetical protein